VFEANVEAVFNSQSDFIRMFTVWKPNVLDGMDSSYIDRPGSTETGQFAFALTRETGQVQIITAMIVQAAMEHINGPNALKDNVNHPVIMNFAGKDTYAVRIMIPIVNLSNKEVVGVVGCQLDTGLLQPRIEETIKEFEEIALLSIYCNDGFVMGSGWTDRIGKNMKDVEIQFGNYITMRSPPSRRGRNTPVTATPPRWGRWWKSPWPPSP
jgi:methyl-accepting chemotaxis protein